MKPLLKISPSRFWPRIHSCLVSSQMRRQHPRYVQDNKKFSSNCTLYSLCVFISLYCTVVCIYMNETPHRSDTFTYGILLYSALIMSMLQLLIALYFSIFWYFLFKSPFPPQASEKSRFLFLGNLKPVQITQLTEVIFGFSFWLRWMLGSLPRSLPRIFFVRPPLPHPSPSPTCVRSDNIKSKSLCRLCAHKSAQKGFYRVDDQILMLKKIL